ncbi:MAG TPA: hypothetical protein VM367_18190 [Pseudonocardia sp.]|nr:hypothetical protein [Pseudonocardia sp.]
MPDVTRRYRHLLVAADRDKLSLPPDVAAARMVLDRVTAALPQLTAPPPPQTVLDAAVDAALNSTDPAALNVDAVIDQERRQREHDTRVRVLRAARERADEQLRDTIADSTDVIVADHVRPTGEHLWQQIRAAVEALGDVEISNPDALLAAPDKARRAYLALDSLAARYTRLRTVLSELLRDAPGPEHDVTGDHAEFRVGLCAIWPDHRRSPSLAAATPPWPEDGRGRLVWLVRGGHEPWWPLVAERDAAWLTCHREAHEHTQRRNALHRLAHAWS